VQILELVRQTIQLRALLLVLLMQLVVPAAQRDDLLVELTQLRLLRVGIRLTGGILSRVAICARNSPQRLVRSGATRCQQQRVVLELGRLLLLGQMREPLLELLELLLVILLL